LCAAPPSQPDATAKVEGKGAGVLDTGPFSFFIELLSLPYLVPESGGGKGAGRGGGPDRGGTLSTLGAIPTSGVAPVAAPEGIRAGGGGGITAPVGAAGGEIGPEVTGSTCGSDDGSAGPGIGAAEVDGVDGADGVTGTAGGGTAGVTTGAEPPETGALDAGCISGPPTGAGVPVDSSFGRAVSGRAGLAGISTVGEPAPLTGEVGANSVGSGCRETGVLWAPCVVAGGVVERCPLGTVENSWSPAGIPDAVGSGWVRFMLVGRLPIWLGSPGLAAGHPVVSGTVRGRLAMPDVSVVVGVFREASGRTGLRVPPSQSQSLQPLRVKPSQHRPTRPITGLLPIGFPLPREEMIVPARRPPARS